MIIGVLLAVAIPAFMGARERSQDRAAQANIRHAVAAANVAYQDEQDYTTFTEAELNAVEPSLTFASSSANPAGNTSAKRIHFQVSNETRIVLGAEAISGRCFYAQDNKATAGANRGATFMDGADALDTATGCTNVDGDVADAQLGVADPDWKGDF